MQAIVELFRSQQDVIFRALSDNNGRRRRLHYLRALECENVKPRTFRYMLDYKVPGLKIDGYV